MAESAFMEILNNKQKKLIIRCVYKHPKMNPKDFTNNHIMSLLDTVSIENDLIIDNFNVNLINYNNDKTTSTFYGACSVTPFCLLLLPQLESQEILKH